jgi:hypothetical protein
LVVRPKVSDFDIDTILRSARVRAEPVDLSGAKAPKRHAVVQASRKNVDMKIMLETYIEC